MQALVFPVCTGMNRQTVAQDVVLGGVPRMHGDEPLLLTPYIQKELCSPYARG